MLELENRRVRVGDYAWYELGRTWDPTDRHILVVRLIRVEIVAIGPKRVTIKLVDFPQWRARNVLPTKIRW